MCSGALYAGALGAPARYYLFRLERLLLLRFERPLGARCESALPAAILLFLLVRGLRKTLEAALAARALVLRCLAIGLTSSRFEFLLLISYLAKAFSKSLEKLSRNVTRVDFMDRFGDPYGVIRSEIPARDELDHDFESPHAGQALSLACTAEGRVVRDTTSPLLLGNEQTEAVGKGESTMWLLARSKQNLGLDRNHTNTEPFAIRRVKIIDLFQDRFQDMDLSVVARKQREDGRIGIGEIDEDVRVHYEDTLSLAHVSSHPRRRELAHLPQ